MAKTIRKNLTITLVSALLLFSAMPQPAWALWQYGIQMAPTTANYDAPEMPTGGVYWSQATTGDAPTEGVFASTSDGYETHVGWLYNGYGSSLSLGCAGGSSSGSLPSGQYGFWREVYSGSSCVSAMIMTLPDGWQASDQMRYASAVYTNKGEFSFSIQDVTRGSSLGNSVCSTGVTNKFTSRVGSIFEADYTTTNFHDLRNDHIALWAQVISSGQRNSGNAYLYNNGSPTSILIYVNSANDAQMGFYTGTHYTDTSTPLWNGNSSAGNELVPPSRC